MLLSANLTVVGLQGIAPDDRPQQPRASNTSSISSALQQHALAAQRRGPTHLPPSSVGPPSKRSKVISSRADAAPHTASMNPQKPPISASALPASVHATPDHPVAPATQQQPHSGTRNPRPVQSSAIPGIVTPGPLPSKGPLPMPSNLCSSAWPVLPYLENVEYAIAHADSQPLTFHRTVSRPLSDFLTAVMHSLGVQVRCLMLLHVPVPERLVCSFLGCIASFSRVFRFTPE